MLVISQIHDSDSDTPVLVNDPLRIPDVIFPVDVNTNFRNPPSVAARSITVDNFEFHSYEPLIRKYETYDMAWFMASFAHRDRSQLSGDVNPEEHSTVLGDTVEQHTIQSSAKIVKKTSCQRGQLQTLHCCSHNKKMIRRRQMVELLPLC